MDCHNRDMILNLQRILGICQRRLCEVVTLSHTYKSMVHQWDGTSFDSAEASCNNATVNAVIKDKGSPNRWPFSQAAV